MKPALNFVFCLILLGAAACGEAGQGQSKAAAINLEMVDTPVDPVCRMNMTGLPIADTLTYEGRTYPLCNAKCKAQFEADPALYVKPPIQSESQEGQETPSGS